jgi:hypothetical protein
MDTRPCHFSRRERDIRAEPPDARLDQQVDRARLEQTGTDAASTYSAGSSTIELIP